MINRKPISRRYPRRSDISRAVEAARENGISVSSIETSPEGIIRLSSSSSPTRVSEGEETEFDLWDREGKL